MRSKRNTGKKRSFFGGTGKTGRASGKSGEAKEKSGVSFTTPEKGEELQKKLVNTGRRRSFDTTPRKCGALPGKLVKSAENTGKRWRKTRKKWRAEKRSFVMTSRKRKFWSAILYLILSAKKRTAFIRKHHLYGAVGENCSIQMRKLPLIFQSYIP